MASLIGRHLPAVALPMTGGGLCHLNAIEGRVVIFIYPYTGRPGHSDPPGWDNIPGAHGSTPEALGFSNLCNEFEKHNVKLFGVSFQTTEWQNDFVLRNQLQVPLLSDEQQAFSQGFGLDTFRAGEVDYLVRRTLICDAGMITHDFYPVLDPAGHAQQILQEISA